MRLERQGTRRLLLYLGHVHPLLVIVQLQALLKVVAAGNLLMEHLRLLVNMRLKRVLLFEILISFLLQALLFLVEAANERFCAAYEVLEHLSLERVTLVNLLLLDSVAVEVDLAGAVRVVVHFFALHDLRGFLERHFQSLAMSAESLLINKAAFLRHNFNGFRAQLRPVRGCSIALRVRQFGAHLRLFLELLQALCLVPLHVLVALVYGPRIPIRVDRLVGRFDRVQFGFAFLVSATAVLLVLTKLNVVPVV